MLAARANLPAASASEGEVARFHSQILDTVGQAVIVTDLAGTILSWNQFAETLYGWKKEEAIGKTLAIVVPNEALEHAEAIIKFLAAGEPWSGQFRVRRRDGSTFIAEITNVPLISDGIVQAVVGVSQDITERKKTEAALRRSEEHFRGLIEQAPFGIQVFAPNGRTVRVNRAWEKLWGLTLDQIADFNILEDPQLRAQGVLSLLRKGFEGETVFIPEIFYDLKPDAPGAITTRRWGSAVVYPLRDVQGRVQEVAVLYQDITARKKAEDALKENELRYRAIGESIDYGIWICDSQGRNTYISKSFLRLTGLTQEECLGLGWTRALHPGDAVAVTQAWNECVIRGGQWDRELRLRGTDGGWYPVLSRAVPVRNEDGQITSWVGINLDISRLKRVEAELRLIDERKNQFLASLAHELRNPLTPISNALELWARLPRDAPDAGQLHGIMVRQVQQLRRLIDDLMDVSRIARGKIQLRKEPVSIQSVLAAAIEAVQPILTVAGHALTVFLPEEPIVVDADASRLIQVFTNILNNAAKYMSDSGAVHVSATADQGEAVVRIRDNGPGIPSNMLAEIFEMFRQLDETLERSRGGLGIGLTLVKQIVLAHGGSVEAKSEASGRGAEFVVRLPIASGEPDHGDAIPRS